ncbi:MAG: S41 family peptidase [Alphaproteobacteria bacterium]
MNKIFRRGISAVLAAGVIGAAVWAPLSTAQNDETYRQLKLFGDVFDTVRQNYVEEVDEKSLIEAAIQGMLQSLDPHSAFEPPEAYEETRKDVRGTFGGIGIQVTMEDGYVKVIAPIDDTPGARAGLQAEDLITALDGESVQGKTLDQAVEIMRGELGSDITLSVYRPATQESFDVTVTRGNIPLMSVRTIIEDGDIGYIRINRFLGTTGKSLETEIAKLQEEAEENDVELVGYILDLRNNPGGNLNQSIRVADAFLEQGEIVSVRNRDSAEDASYFAEKGDLINGKPLVVLINGGSASASEIVAGALQDHKRGILLGTPTFGKGSVQTLIGLGDQGGLRLTTARYYTPSGDSIQAKGIEPDILVELAKLEPLEGYSSENFRYESDFNNALDDGAAEGEETEDATPADETATDEEAPSEGEEGIEGEGEGQDGETPADGEEGDEETAEEEEEPAEEFFDFQLVRAKDLIRGIAIFQN